ncbi:polysaccharide deacetylase family protein [Corynebacterium pacaense]|uniref:polysaccharide deacetylase family protein n=1 Tax=Corynebacterium pacaense TaxID=1816684 RepID=UPI0009B9E563|nr:polysaccharide deacetylase family protein [Corynebacterium pacaense]
MSYKERHSARQRATSLRMQAADLMDQPVESTVRGAAFRRLQSVALMSVVVVLLVALLSTGFAYNWWSNNIGSKVSPPDFSFTGEESDLIKELSLSNASNEAMGFGSEPLVLTYHDIRPEPPEGSGEPVNSVYVVTPDKFDRQMGALHESGYRSMTSAEFDAYRAGTYQPPSNSFYLTFDDGTSGLYKYADRILDKYGFTATSYLIGSFIGQHRPYYMTWSQIELLHRSGRWDFQSHSNGFHYRTGQGDRLVPAVAARLWVDDRWETDEEFTDRINQDFEEISSQFREHGLPTPTQFAFPFSTASSDFNRNDPTHQLAVHQMTQNYRTAFTNVGNPLPAATSARNPSALVERLEVTADDTAVGLLRRASAMQSVPVGDYDAISLDASWLQPKRYIRAPIDDRDLEAGIVRMDADTMLTAEALWASQRTAEWDQYTVTADAMDLGPETYVGLGARVGNDSAQELKLLVSADSYRVLRGNSTIEEGPLLESSEKNIGLETSESTSRFYVDGQLVYEGASSEGQGGFSVVSKRTSADIPFAALRNISTGTLGF